MNDFWIYIFLMAMIGVLMIFMLIAANRKMKGFKIIVLRDLRNPNRTNIKYWAMYNSHKDEYIKLYSNIFRPTKSKIKPPADMGGYSYDHTVYAIQGPSGHPDDDNIVFIHLPLIGQASADQLAISQTEAIQRTLLFKKWVDEKGLKIGMIVDYNNTKFWISSIDFNGISLSAELTDEHGNKKTETKRLTSFTEFNNIRILETPSDATTPQLADYFNREWIMQNMGVVPIEDANLMLAQDKAAIASFNSKLHDRALSNLSMFARYPWLLPMIIMVFVVVISSSILWYSISQDTAHVGNVATAAIQHIAGMTNNQTQVG